MSEEDNLGYRIATAEDAALLAEQNRLLIEDEGHRNPMTVPELERRMRDWLQGEYTAVIFELAGRPAAYALYRADSEGIYLRQFFVDRAHRRNGIGRAAITLLRDEIWPPGTRITVEVLASNRGGYDFWRAVGFRDYAVTLELI